MRTPLLLPLGTLLAALTSCGLHRTSPQAAPPPPAPTKIGFLHASPVSDAGWAFQHDQGRKEVEANLKGQITTEMMENIPEGPRAEQAIRQMVQDGCKAVFAISFGYMSQTNRVAAETPGTVFFQASGLKTSKNVGIYNARLYEGRYLCGVVAGRMTKTHVAGYVAAHPTPDVIQGINAFTRGMRSVDPKAEVRVIWVHGWSDLEKDREAVKSLVAQGADMITNHTNGNAVVQAVEELNKGGKQVWSFSFHSDLSKYGPTSQLTGCTHVWGDFYTEVTKQVLAGTWTGTNVWGGFREGMLRLAPFNPIVPADVRGEVAKIQAQIAAGTFHPFAGPVVAQDGTLKVPAGAVMSDADIKSMRYYVQGVTSTLN